MTSIYLLVIIYVSMVIFGYWEAEGRRPSKRLNYYNYDDDSDIFERQSDTEYQQQPKSHEEEEGRGRFNARLLHYFRGAENNKVFIRTEFVLLLGNPLNQTPDTTPHLGAPLKMGLGWVRFSCCPR